MFLYKDRIVDAVPKARCLGFFLTSSKTRCGLVDPDSLDPRFSESFTELLDAP